MGIRRETMRFYTIKLPKFLGGIVRAMLNTFKKIKKAPITGAFSIVIVKKEPIGSFFYY